MNNKKIKAFTLAEAMIVLVILGVIASITIPAVVRRQMEAQNRTRIRKAMTVYDTAINKMVVENGIKSNEALIQFGNNNECANTKPYFKVSQEDENNCIFRSSDGVWWNIEDITHPIVSFDFDDLNKADEENNKAFKLVGYLDDNGILRVGDLGTASDDNKTVLTKLYNYVNNKKTTEVAQNSTPRLKSICYKSQTATKYECKAYDEKGNQTAYSVNCTGAYISSCSSIIYSSYDSNGNQTAEGCDESKTSCHSYFKYDSTGNMIGGSCNKSKTRCSNYYAYDEKGNQTAKGSSCTGTGISSCSSKQYFTYDEKGNQTAKGSSCTGTGISSCSSISKYAYTYDEKGNQTAKGLNCTVPGDISSCSNFINYTYDSNGNQTAKGSSCTGTGISSCYLFENYTYDEKGNKTAEGSSCKGTDISSCSSYNTYDSNGNMTGQSCNKSKTRCYWNHTYDENGNKTVQGSNCTGTDINSCSSVTTYTNEYWDD